MADAAGVAELSTSWLRLAGQPVARLVIAGLLCFSCRDIVLLWALRDSWPAAATHLSMSLGALIQVAVVIRKVAVVIKVDIDGDHAPSRHALLMVIRMVW